MANKRQRKKAAKLSGTYPGWVHSNVRESGRINLKKTSDGNLVNEHGVVFTPDEKRAMVNAVNRVNRKRAKMLKEAATLPRAIAGRDSGDTVSSLQSMGKDSDFILAKRTKSLQRFKTRAQFEKYMRNLERVNVTDYLSERVKLYKRNHMKAIENVFGKDDAKDVLMKIRMMKHSDYMTLIEKDEVLEIGYIYDPSELSAKLNQIRAGLKMKLKEDPFNS